MPHTILLLQAKTSMDSRVWSDYQEVNQCLDSITYIFEEHLKKLNPNSAQITYDIANLFDFIDQLPDLSILVLNQRTAMYMPHDKEWVKQQLFLMFKQQIGGGGGGSR